ncbi:MAG: hypothetical protein ABSF74_04675 [Dehalococcoidia bacterium]|jgi:hypothetical protein
MPTPLWIFVLGAVVVFYTLIRDLVRNMRPFLEFLIQNKSTILKILDITFDIIWFAALISAIWVAYHDPVLNTTMVLLIWVFLYGLIASLLSTLRDFGVGGRSLIWGVHITVVLGAIITLIVFWWGGWTRDDALLTVQFGLATIAIIFFVFFAALGIFFGLKRLWQSHIRGAD